MRRVTWVTAEVPDTALGGGSIRQAHLLRALAPQAEVHLLVTGELRDEGLRAALASVTEVPVGVRRRPRRGGPRRAADVAWALADRRSREVFDTALAAGALRRALRSVPRGGVVQVEHEGLAPLIRERRAGERWAITLHSLESVRVAHRLRLAPGARHRWLLGRELAKARALERAIAARYDAVWLTSPDDGACFPGTAAVVPNGVDTARFRPSPIPAAPQLVFTGTLDYLPNVDAATWFCRDVLPSVRASVPDVRLDLVGRRPVGEVVALGGHGVGVHADVADVQPYLDGARVAVVPVRIGSGTRLKALEAMAAGRPVAGTSIGLAGLGLVPGRDALVADSPDALARSVVELLTDDGRAGDIARAGRAIAEVFSWERVAAEFTRRLLGA